MNAKQLAKILTTALAAKLPVMIKGAPGIGKSDIVAQAAKALKADLLISHPVVSDPTDFKGLPAIVKGKDGKELAEFLPFGDLRQLLTAKKLTVAFLDDLGQAPAVVQAAAMQLILARQINGHKVSDHVVFVAATNRREDKAGVTGILEPVKSRFATIVELEPDVESWCTWAVNNDVPVEVIAFIRFRPALLMDTGKPTNDIVNRPSPRTVTNLGRLYAAGIRDMETLAGATGEGFASEFVGFIRIWESLPNVDAVLLDPDGSDIPNEPAALFAIATALAARVNADNASKVIRYAKRLPEEYGVLCIRDSLRKCPAAGNNKEFISWAVEHQDILS